jgi:hypothetical protein
MTNDKSRKLTFEDYGVSPQKPSQFKPTLDLDVLTSVVLTQDDGDPSFLTYDEIIKRA